MLLIQALILVLPITALTVGVVDTSPERSVHVEECYLQCCHHWRRQLQVQREAFWVCRSESESENLYPLGRKGKVILCLFFLKFEQRSIIKFPTVCCRNAGRIVKTAVSRHTELCSFPSSWTSSGCSAIMWQCYLPSALCLYNLLECHWCSGNLPVDHFYVDMWNSSQVLL